MQIKSLCSLAVMALFAGCGDGGGGSDGGWSPQTVEPVANEPVAKKAPALCPTNDNGANYACPAMSGFNGDESTTIITQGNARVEHIEFAQLHLKQPDSQYFVAIANREALIRVVVTADAGQTNLKAPALKLTLTNQDTGVVVMQTTLQPATGQMVLPISGDAVDAARGNATVPDLYRSYLYRLSADVLPAANLQVKAEIDTIGSGLQDMVFVDNAKTITLQPVAVPTLKLVAVPIHVSGTEPNMPSDSTILNAIYQLLPVSSVSIRSHEPFIVADSVLGGIAPEKYENGPSRALSLIDWDQRGKFSDLPKIDRASNEIYIGFVHGNVGGTTNQYTDTVLVSDEISLSNEASVSVLPHEIMHVFDFGHQEICGATNGSPEFFPYSDFGIGPDWGVNLNKDKTITIKSKFKYKSFLGYCYPGYISDFHVNEFVTRIKTRF